MATAETGTAAMLTPYVAGLKAQRAECVRRIIDGDNEANILGQRAERAYANAQAKITKLRAEADNLESCVRNLDAELAYQAGRAS